MAQSLAPGGFLFLGHGETLWGISDEFHLCHTHDTFYYERKECSAGHSSAWRTDLGVGRGATFIFTLDSGATRRCRCHGWIGAHTRLVLGPCAVDHPGASQHP